MTIQFSRRLAIVAGILAPLAETIRRWSTWQQSPANLFDDYIMGAFLLYGAWRTGRDLRSGQRVLAGGVGFYLRARLLQFLWAVEEYALT